MVKEKELKRIIELKGKKPISMITAYDAVFSHYACIAGIDLILVGDSVANVMLGYHDTKKISMDEMIHHVEAVTRINPSKPVIADMPIHSYNNPLKALKNAKLFLKARADAVKLEGTKHAKSIKALRNEGIEIMGHIGLTPQSAGKYRVVGKTDKEAKKLIEEALLLDSLEVFSIVLECVPNKVAEEITSIVSVPTIGIGAGPYCDGQVLVVNDLIGLSANEFKPKFVKQYANITPLILKSLMQFNEEVKNKKFPGEEFSYK
ncbi:MAG: 3-methyl-2-oxobutanoate hydroxymethyltransferase [Candidatus Diapherotrites archaeon]|nr:3-methyl-2-oxobutanoate hydroxymethyltransferase [Candidatus Diapherotrites archaeon]